MKCTFFITLFLFSGLSFSQVERKHFTLINKSEKKIDAFLTRADKQIEAIHIFAGAQPSLDIVVQDCISKNRGEHIPGKITICIDAHPALFAHEYGHHVCSQALSTILQFKEAMEKIKQFFIDKENARKTLLDIEKQIKQLQGDCKNPKKMEEIQKLFQDHQIIIREVAKKLLRVPKIARTIHPYTELCADVVAVLTTMNPRYMREMFPDSDTRNELLSFSKEHTLEEIKDTLDPHYVLAPVKSSLWNKSMKDVKTDEDKKRFFDDFMSVLKEEVGQFIVKGERPSNIKMNKSFLRNLERAF